jgi:hypothetical protein
MILVVSGCDDRQHRATGRASVDAAVQAAARTGADGGFTGVFHATGDGTRSVLNLTARDGRLTGMLDAANITAQVDGATARGDVKDAATAAKLGTIHLALSGDTVALTLTAVDPRSGATLRLPTVTYSRGVAPPIDIQRDAQLAGRWRHSWDAGDGAAGASTERWLVLYPDGTVQHGKSKGPTTDAIVGHSIADDEGGFVGKWRTTDRTLYVMPDGHAHWTPYAQYQIEGEKLLLTFNDGTRQVYSRN